MTDDLDRFRAMRPATAADDNWADSVEGRTALERIHRRAASDDHAQLDHRRRWRRPVAIVSAAVVVVGGATAATVVIARAPNNPAQVLCLRTASPSADGAGLELPEPTPAAALRACSSQWSELFPGDPTPGGYAVCVYPATPVRNGASGGGQVVIPTNGTNTGSAAACAAAGFDPVTTS